MSPKQNKNINLNNLSEAEKKDILRIRNTENARNNRKRWKDNDREMEELYTSNQSRIHKLERMVDELSAELADNSSRRYSRAGSSKSGR